MTPDATTLLDRNDGASSPEIDLDDLEHFDDLLDLEGASSSSPLHSPRTGPIPIPLLPFYSRANAVHMEVQENARLPTLNLSVDRTNSGLPRGRSSTQYSPDTRRDIDEMVRLSEQDFSLTEVFLTSNYRSSRNMNYNNAGALMSSIGNRIGNGEVRHEDLSRQTLTVGLSNVPLSTSISATTTPAHSTQDQSRYAYGRPYQLPIPRSVEPTVPPIPRSVEPTVPPITKVAYDAPSPAPAPAPAPAPVCDIKGDAVKPHTSPLVSTSPKPPMGRPPFAPSLPGAATPTYHSNESHAKSRANPTASMFEATLRRSQFGFGDGHVVPSTVHPPTKKTKARPLLPPSPPSSPITMNSGAAYERKKQRAKDSRVKLNEAIENLSIAINLAGSQSKQRATQLKVLPNNSDRQRMLDAMNDGVYSAESVKKWERPSFVNTAATLMQNLNTQCEALMRVVLRLKCEGTEDLKRAQLQLGEEHSPAKRRKVTPTNGITPETSPRDPVTHVFHTKSILLVIASFLDPMALLRCHCLSRSIRDFGAFHDESVWLQGSLIARFGMFNVRQWKDLLEDCTSSITLYQKMDAANIRPHSTEEGSLLLGEGRMQGKVSAWVSMIERSNGETCRSVKVEGKNEYTSLPVVELRYLIQNTGYSEVAIKEQTFSVDASTRRRGEEWKEINWDDRFQKVLMKLDGSPWPPPLADDFVLCRLRLFESVIVVVHVNAKGCSTMSKFQRRANFTKLLVNFNGATLPLVVPFFREGP